MSISMHNPYDAPEPSNNFRLFINVLLLSLLAHAVLVVLFLLGSIFSPMALPPVPKTPPTVSLSLQPPPALPPKQIFVPTNPEVNAPHKVQPIISANDHDLTSQSKVARNPDSIMPDINGKDHSPDLNTSPKVETPPKPEVSSTPPTPRVAKPDKPTPPQPKPQTEQVKPQPPQPPAKPTPAPPQKQQPLVDANGLPLLPAINAPTLAPPDSAPPPAAPAPSQLQQAASVHGSLGRAGDNSPAAMATELGKYKQYVYQVVGSYWYPEINKHFQTIGAGIVQIQFTIHSDGSLTDVRITQGDNYQILRDISHGALRSPAPFKPFSPAMIKEVGDSYTDEFSFSIYN
jgi:outer membrane biosynthesis protein TonB